MDDDDAVRAMMRRALESVGISVREAADGAEAVSALAAERPDLVLLDLRMPGMDGHAVLGAMEAAGARVPTVVVSAFLADDRARLPGWAVAAEKPIALDDLPALVAEALRRVPPADDAELARRILSMLGGVAARISETRRHISAGGR